MHFTFLFISDDTINKAIIQCLLLVPSFLFLILLFSLPFYPLFPYLCSPKSVLADFLPTVMSGESTGKNQFKNLKIQVMSNYELMVIFTPVLSEEDFKASQKKYELHQRKWWSDCTQCSMGIKITGLPHPEENHRYLLGTGIQWANRP